MPVIKNIIVGLLVTLVAVTMVGTVVFATLVAMNPEWLTTITSVVPPAVLVLAAGWCVVGSLIHLGKRIF